MSDSAKVALRRVVRVQRLLHELGHTDVIGALEELKRLRLGEKPRTTGGEGRIRTDGTV
jgi:hypothetical protein